MKKSDEINFRDIRTGDTIVLDGSPEIVQSKQDGNGFISFRGKTARPVKITFISGKTISHHPGNRVVVTRVES